jgi:hypothetical protein
MFTRSRLAALLLLLTFAALPAAAQEFGPGMLPADTSFVIFSRGTAHAETAYPNNPMVLSSNGPEFADLRAQGINYLARHADWKINGRPVKFTPAEAELIFSFLKGPMMLGYWGSLDVSSLAQASAPSTKQLMDAGGMFLIIDATGKTTQFDLLFKFIEANVSKDVTRSRSDFSGVSIEKFAGPNNTSYATRVGNYFVWSNQQKVIQDLVSRLGSRTSTADSLSQNPSYQRCQAKPDPDSIYEMYFRVPDLTKTSVPGAPGQFDTSAALRTLKLDSLRAACGSVALTQEGEHARGLILGETSAGGIVDLFGANRSHFDTLDLAPASAYSYFSYSFDLPATYKLARAVAMAGLPEQQASMIQMVEGVAAMQIGMPLADALALSSGEFATIQLDPTSTPPSQIYAVSISNPEKVSTLIHKVGSNSYEEVSKENGITLFKSKSAAPAAANSTDPAVPTYLAVTPHFLLYATDKQALTKAAQSDFAGKSAGRASLLDNPEISKLRAILPKELLGLSITDYSHYDWAAELTKSIDKSEKADASKLSAEDIQFFDSLKKFNASKLGKMILRRSVDGWWKDSEGIHYEGFDQ